MKADVPKKEEKSGINFTMPLLDHKDKGIPDAVEGQGAWLTLGAATRHALCMSYPDEQNLSGEEKFKRAKLAFDVCESHNAVLKAQDITMIKQLIGKFYAPAVVYAAYRLLDPAE